MVCLSCLKNAVLRRAKKDNFVCDVKLKIKTKRWSSTFVSNHVCWVPSIGISWGSTLLCTSITCRWKMQTGCATAAAHLEFPEPPFKFHWKMKWACALSRRLLKLSCITQAPKREEKGPHFTMLVANWCSQIKVTLWMLAILCQLWSVKTWSACDAQATSDSFDSSFLLWCIFAVWALAILSFFTLSLPLLMSLSPQCHQCCCTVAPLCSATHSFSQVQRQTLIDANNLLNLMWILLDQAFLVPETLHTSRGYPHKLLLFLTSGRCQTLFSSSCGRCCMIIQSHLLGFMTMRSCNLIVAMCGMWTSHHTSRRC